MTTSHPLKWPDGWQRTPAHKRHTSSNFGKRSVSPGQTWASLKSLTPAQALQRLYSELERLKVTHVVVSSNVPRRLDGEMHSGAAERRYDDPGVAVYFTLKGMPTVMAQDVYVHIADNIASLAMAIEAMRTLERHGGGLMMERAFEGFAQLEGPRGARPARPWFEVLQFAEDERTLISAAEVEAKYRRLAKSAHPDAGGSADKMAELNAAKDSALAEIGARQ